MYENRTQNYDPEIHEKISHTWYTHSPVTSFKAKKLLKSKNLDFLGFKGFCKNLKT